MSNVTNGTIEQIDQQIVTTKFGAKPTFSFRIGGDWFKTGFKRHNLNVGDVASFPFNEGRYGKEVDVASITKGGTAAPAAASVTSLPTPAAAAVPARTTSYGSKGAFPIPALDGQRAIVRQNSLTNAVKFAEFAENEPSVNTIIAIARKFEAYSCGDLDSEEVAAEMAAEEAAAAAASAEAAAKPARAKKAA